MNRLTQLFLTLVIGGILMPLSASAQNNILFVGDSFTFSATVWNYNAANVTDLNPGTDDGGFGGVPGVFQKMASDLGYSCKVYMEADSATTLDWHYQNRSATLAQSKWNQVVLQEYSTFPTTNAGDIPVFHTGVNELKSFLTNSAYPGPTTAPSPNANANPNVKIFLYETWARPDICSLGNTQPDGHDFPDLATMISQLSYNYYNTNSIYGLNGVAPVGDAFALAQSMGFAQLNPYVGGSGFDLWHTDDYHSSNWGSYLAGAVLMAKITGLDPRNIPTGANSCAAGIGIPSADAVNLNNVAYLATATAPTITSGNSTTFAVGQNSTFTVTAQGQPTPTYSATGLPAWATLNTTTGAINGTPPDTNGSPYTVAITATNGVSPSATQNLTISVFVPVAPTITSGAAPSTGTTGVPYSFTYSATGAPTPTFSVVSGALPPGLSLNSASGLLSGNPTTVGTYPVTIQAGNGINPSATQPLTIVVSLPPSVAPQFTNGPATATAPQGKPYSFTYTVSGYPAPTFSLLSGTLPPGLTLDPNAGIITGSPSTTGTYTGVIQAGNGVNQNATQSFSISVLSSHTVLIDIGAATAVGHDTVNNLYWNDIPQNFTSSNKALVDAGDASTSLTFTAVVTQAISSGVTGSDLTNAGVTSPTGTVYSLAATRSLNWAGNNSPISVGGLDATGATTYTFTFFAAANETS
ncbi:Ig domain-containing protein, partial [Methylacidiphilales bacterium]|nr:Ig domain-containing protein [Candidatus Methylacidiphilales bacterium]